MVKRCSFFLILLFTSLTTHADLFDWSIFTTNPKPELGSYDRPEDYPAVHVTSTRYIPTPSGNSIALRVTFPADADGAPLPGPFPVLLVQSGYNSGVLAGVQIKGGSFLGAPDPYMVKRGYVQVSADVVGTGASEGGWKLIGEEEQQGYAAVVDWIKQQPWYDGNLGVTGISYMAITAVLTAQYRPDDVKAVFSGASLGDAMRGTAGTGGMANGVLLSGWTKLTHFASILNDVTKNQNPELADRIDAATQRHVEQIDNFYLPMFERMLNGDPELRYDSDFWRLRSPLQNADRIKAPTFVTGALDDVFQRGAPALYEILKGRVDTRLLIYNGNHIESYISALPGTKETVALANLQLQWFDRYLKGIDSHIEDIPQVTQFVKRYDLGLSKGFATASDWPHPAATPLRLYLHGAGGLTPWKPFFTEKTRSMQAPEFASVTGSKNEDGTLLDITVTPNDGTECSHSMAQWTLGFAALQFNNCYHTNNAIEEDALNYQTAPLLQDWYLNGPIQADLWISSSTPDAVVSVRVDIVTPLGEVIPLSNGLLLASMRAVDINRSRIIDGQMVQPWHYFSRETEQPLIPGRVTKLQVEIFPTSALIRAGNRLRVSISPSNQAQGILDLPRREHVRGGTTKIHHSPRYPSSVVLSKVPTSELN